MRIELQNTSKRFKKIWIFKDINYVFESNKTYAITGSNGSGKSTLLKTIAGFEHYHKGKISYFLANKEINKNDIAFYFTFCAPYQDLIKEMKLHEFLDFHQKMTDPFDTNKMLEEVGLNGNENKILDEFSSGMMQRLKLGICFYSNRTLLLLDEPTSNLDVNGKLIFKQLMLKNKESKTILIASNEQEEIDLCDEVLSVEKF
jgi:ABC-type multidrug transport system ATPase subunit